ncbi:hypothetical protein RND81_06G139400 [Saponaria officinalis]|uniref:Uncharacterized protein n=1 Tax=Saponaria officinalis TaxID=3572 RepID=A0AAW1KAB2_SAPOF
MQRESERTSFKLIRPLMAASELQPLWNHSIVPQTNAIQLFHSETTYVEKKKRKRGESNAWREAEDEALMSAWCVVSTNPTLGKNQNQHTRWTKVSELYEQSRLKNPRQISAKSCEAMRSRFRRLNVLSNKWISCMKMVRSQPRISGTNAKDDEAAAQSLFSGDNKDKRFEYLSLFNNVMSKNPKWSLDNTDVQQLDTNLSVDVNVSLEAGDQPSNRSLKRLDNDDVQQLRTNPSVDANVSLEVDEQLSNRSLKRLDNDDVQQLDTNLIVDANVSLETGEQPSNRSLKRLYNNDVQQLDANVSIDANVSLEDGEQPSIGSLERLRTSEDVESNPETPKLVHHHLEGRDVVNEKHKGKSSAFEDSIAEPYCACCAQFQTLCIIREKEIEIMKRRIESDREIEKVRIELEEKKIQEKNKRLEMKMLNTLVGKEHLSSVEERVKFDLLRKYYPQK